MIASTEKKRNRRRKAGRRAVSAGKLSHQLPWLVRRNPLGLLKWAELTVLGRRASPTCYNYPFIVQIETTNHCNLKCGFCPRELEFKSAGLKLQSMSMKDFDGILGDWIHRVYQLHLFGRGEPLLSKELPEMIHYAAERGVPYISFTSNGTILRGDRAKSLADTELSEIRVSLDGSDEETFKGIRGASLEKIKDNLRKFREMSDIPISVNCVLTGDNWDSVRRMDELCAEIGAVTLRLFPVAPYNFMGHSFPGLEHERKLSYKDFCDDLGRRCKEKGVNFASISHHQPQCNVPFIMSFIDVTGSMTYCCKLETMTVGNILKDGFWNVWRGSQLEAWRQKLVNGTPPKECTELECIHDWREPTLKKIGDHELIPKLPETPSRPVPDLTLVPDLREPQSPES
jgi:MoaA/NifB/PqqE/SkfB family radical SAM enzyme